jgi:hypothetical protein
VYKDQLRQWGVPFDALASVFGRNAMFWYRAWLAVGRPSLVGTTVKDPHQVPRDLVADEQLTRGAKQQVSVPTPVGGGCFLGVSVVEAADTVTLEPGYGACAKEAKALAPAYQARSVCTDGWEATRQAWRGRFPKIKVGLCFLHSILKMKKYCTSNAVDRRLDYQDRLLDAMRSWHGTTDSARLAVRAMALQWNFHPYGTRLRRDQPSRVSPFHDLNGLQYHSNWLHNLLIASSMGGLRH